MKHTDVELRLDDDLHAALCEIAAQSATTVEQAASVLAVVSIRAALREAAEQHESLEIKRLRGLAAACYAGLVAEHNLPDTWANAFYAASVGEEFTTEGLLPYEPQ